MTAAWPSSIPVPVLQDGFTEQPETNVTQFQPEVGAPKMRRRTSISTDLISVKDWYSSSQYQAIRAFYKKTLLDGTQRFTMRHPRTKGSATWTFVPGQPPKIGSTFGLTHEVLFQLRLISGGEPPPAWQFNDPGNSFFIHRM